jgi:hypothetical protein
VWFDGENRGTPIARNVTIDQCAREPIRTPNYKQRINIFAVVRSNVNETLSGMAIWMGASLQTVHVGNIGMMQDYP